MPILVDEDGDGIVDRDDDNSTLGIPALVDESGDGKDDVDLRTDGASAEVNGALVATGSVNSGTGNFNDFLGVQNTGTEFGFNTDTPDPSNPHIKTSSNFTKTIKLSEVGIVTIDGVDYYQFLLDVNESNANPTEQQISLDSFKLYTSLDGTISTLTDLEAQHLAFDIDNADPGNAATENDISILFTDAYSSGSGRSDLSILVPVDAIEAQGDGPADTYIYLYTEFGYAGEDFRTDATFEEWRTVDAVTLQGTKFNDLNQDGIRQEAGADGILGNADDEVGLEGWTIFIDSNGNGVLDADERSTVTDADGNYFFYGVQSDATYTIDEDLSGRPDWIQTTGENETVTVPGNAETGSNIIVDPIGNYQLMPSIHLVKEVPEIIGGSGLNGLAGADSPGDQIVYLFTVTNNGDLALTDVDLTDPNIDGGSLVRLDDIIGNNDDVLDVGEKWAFTATHTVTQDELDSNGDDSSDGPDGDIDNTATVTAQSAGGEVSANDDEDAPLLQIPGIEVLKSVDSVEDDDDFGGSGQVDSAGDVINYNITIANTGNFALSGVTMTDKVEAYSSVNATPVEDGFGFNIGDTDADGYLDVDEVWEYTASYTVTQEDIDNGGGGDGAIDNVATGDTNETLPDQDDATVPIVDAPAINIVKEGVSDDPDCTDAGDTITYTYTVTNTGNVALSGV
ncbi:hypothetical protein, partial [Qipengyuania aquimaris]|uniref:DUF7507 domain-containing protein n=1 Tax=Qipengyuania aquimaris TaxID=255984 RepID=UPI001CD3C892